MAYNHRRKTGWVCASIDSSDEELEYVAATKGERWPSVDDYTAFKLTMIEGGWRPSPRLLGFDDWQYDPDGIEWDSVGVGRRAFMC